jgi:hypothetical protein
MVSGTNIRNHIRNQLNSNDCYNRYLPQITRHLILTIVTAAICTI